MVARRLPARVRWIAVGDAHRELGNAHRAMEQQGAIEQPRDLGGQSACGIVDVDVRVGHQHHAPG